MFRNSTMQRIIASTLLATFASSTLAPAVAFAQSASPLELQPLAGPAAGRSLPGVDANGIPTGKGWQRKAGSAGAPAAAQAAPTQAYGFALSQLESMAHKSRADLAAGRGSDALAQVKALRTQYARLKQEEAAMDQAFAATEAHLRAAGLAGGDILARHQEAVQQFGARKAELKAAMTALDAAAAGKGNVQTALDQLSGLMRQHSSLSAQDGLGRGHAWGKRKKAPPAVAMTPRQHEKRFPRSVQLAAAGSLSGIALPDAILPDAVQPGDLAEQGEVMLTPAVRALAAQLGNNPVAIYNWVRNNIAFVPGFGAMQDADATLLARRGSATDSASLLIALNRAAGIPSRYVYGTIEVPLAKAQNWLGVDSGAAAQALLSQGGIPNRAVTQAGQVGAIQLEHVWVEAFVDFSPSRGGVNKAPGAWVPLDASFKQMDSKPGLDLASAVSLNESGVLSQARQGAVCTPDYAQNLNLQNLQAGYADYKARLNNYLGQQGADLTVGDVLGKRNIAARNYSILLGSLPYTRVAQGAIVNALPDNLRWQFRLQLFAGAAQQAANNPAVSYSGSLAALANKRLTLSFVPASQADADVLASYMPKPHADGSPIQPNELPLEVPGYLVRVKAEIRADGQVVASGGSFVLGSELAGSIDSFDPSNGGWNESSFGAHAGDYHAIAIDVQGVSAGQLAAVKARLNAAQAKLAGGQGASLARDDVSGELLYHAALGYFATVDANAGVFQRAAHMVEQRLPSYGRAVAQAQPEMVMGIVNKVRFPGVVLDIDRLDSAVAQNSGGVAPSAYIKQANERNAAYGHLVLAKLFTSAQTPGQAASPVKALGAAAAAGSKVYAVSAANAAAVMPQVDIAAAAAADIQNAAAAGSRVLVAQGPVNIGNWNGHGLVMEDAGGAGSYRLNGETGYATSALYLPNGTTWLALADPLQAAGAAAPAAQAAQPVNDTLASMLGEAGSTTRWSFYAGQADVASGLFLARLAAGQGSNACDTLAGVIAAGLDTSGGFDTGAVTGAPVITSAPVISGGANQLYSYAVLATDPKGAALVYTLRDAPTGMAISADGVISWAKPVAGTWNVTVRADNGRAYAEQRYQLTVGQQVPLDASLRITPQVINLGESVTIDVLSTGGSGSVTRRLTIDGQDVPLTLEGRATVAGAAIGAHQITATITDSIGTTTRTGTYSVRDPADSTTPVALITAPVDDAEVTAPVNVTGTASATNLAYYQLLLRPAGGNAWSEIARGTSAVTNGVLGKLDPTQLSNGIYELVLSVVDANGRQQTQMITLDVYRDLKIGQFSITFEDMKVEASGIPIRVTRTYDTRRKSEALDFGYGWSVDYQSVRLRKNMVLGLGWDVVAHPAQLSLCLVPQGKRKINITLPDGRVERFTASNRTDCALGTIPQVDIQLVPLPGTTSTLEILNVPNLATQGGQLFDMDNLETWNPKEFKLTTDEKYTYYLKEGVGIVQVKDPFGNTLSYGANGILHSSGQSVSFTRDTKGRITAVTDPSGKSVNYSYDTQGDLASVTNRVGAKSSMTYNHSHALLDYTDPSGSLRARYVYDDDGRLTAIYDADGKAVEISHETTNNREVVKDRRGNATTYTYDGAGNIVERVDALGNTTKFVYDANGNETSTTDALGRTITRSFNSKSNKQETLRDPLGNVTTWEYDGSGTLLSSVTDARGNKSFYVSGQSGESFNEPLGRQTATHNDGAGNLTGVKGTAGTTSFVYDSHGNRIKEIDPVQNVSSFTFDSNNRQLTRSWQRTMGEGIVPIDESESFKRDAEGRITEFTNAAGNTYKYEYDGGGNVVSIAGPGGRSLRFEYDSRGRQRKTVYPDGSSVEQAFDTEGNKVSETDQLGRITTFTYDALNRLVETKRPDGTITTLEYDAAGQVVASSDGRGKRTTFEYDLAGRLVKQTDAAGGTVQYDYDANGNRTGSVNALAQRTTFEFDALNQLVKAVTPGGQISTTEWNASGTVRARVDASGHRIGFGYDALTKLLEVVQGSADSPMTTKFQFDSVGNKIRQIDAEGRVTKWEFDAANRVTARILPEGQRETFAYDPLGNRTSRTAFDGASATTAFDQLGHPVLTVRPDGVRIARTYTANGLTASVAVSAAAGSGVQSGMTTYQYDSRDRVVKQVNPDGTFLAYSYDGNGNVTERSTQYGTDSFSYDAANRLTAVQSGGSQTFYQYDELGRLVGTQMPNGVTVLRSYDTDGRLLQVLHRRADNTVVSGVRYTLAANGQRVKQEEFDSESTVLNDLPANPARVSNFEYDLAGRLVREQVSGRSGDVVITTDFAYDRAGNRKEKKETTAAGVETTSYSYDANDRLKTEIRSTVTGSHVQSNYQWDDNGNLLSKVADGHAVVYEWDSENRLKVVKEGVSLASVKLRVSFTYDENGNRVGKIRYADDGSIAGSVAYLVDSQWAFPQTVVELEKRGENVSTTRYTWGQGLVRQVQDGSAAYFHADGQDSVHALTNDRGDVQVRMSHTAYGSLDGSSGTELPAYRYTGQYFDQDVGLQYNRARWYSAEIGRFVSQDPYPGEDQRPASLNKYAYADNDPVNNADPSGMTTLGELMAGVDAQDSMRSQEMMSAVQNQYNMLKKVCDACQNLGSGVRHHVIPYFMRGLPSKGKTFIADELIDILPAIHNKFHPLLDAVLKFNKLPGKNKGSAHYAGMIAGGTIVDAFNALLEAAELFDTACSVARGNYSMKADMQNMKHLLGL